MDKKKYIHILILLTIMNIYFGWFWHSGYFANTNGFSIANMIYVYFIGGFIRRFVPHSMIDKKRGLFITVYFITTIIWSIISWRFRDAVTYHWQTDAYNNPFILISAIAFFAFFLSFHFQDKIINFIAKGTFAVYVIHEGAYFQNWFKEACLRLCDWEFINSSNMTILLFLAIFAAITVIVLASFDTVRQFVTDKVILHIPNNL